MDDSVKQWWLKVVAAAGADNEQAVLDLEGVMCAMCAVASIWVWMGIGDSFHIVSHHTCCIVRMSFGKQRFEMAHSGAAFTQALEVPELERRVEELRLNVTDTHLSRTNCGWCVIGV